MTELWAILIPILFADVFNLVLFAFLVYAAGTSRPVLNTTMALIGHTVAYFLAGILVALGLEQIADRLANPRTIDFVIELVVALLLLWVAFRSRKGKQSQKKTVKDLTPAKAFGLGAVINFAGIPFAIPYFGAVGQILRADLSVASSLLVLAGYNVLYALAFAVVPILCLVMGERSQPILRKINGWMEKIGGFLIPILLGLLGTVMLVDAVYYLITGRILL